MAVFFTAGKFQAIDADGVISGALLEAYAAGTLVPQDTFTDLTLASPNDWPVECDGNGQATVALDESLAYRFILKRPDGTTVWDEPSNAGLDSSRIQFSFASNYVVGTIGAAFKTLGIDITAAPYNADKTGATSCSAAIAAASAANPGMPLRAPAGTYGLDTEVAYVTTSSNTFSPGFQISGDGPGLTIFDNRVASGFAFRCATNTLNKFQHTVKFADLQIKTTTSPAASGGISLRSCYNVSLENVWITGLSGDGIKVIVQNGDQDGCNMVSLDTVRIENCGGWGFNTEVTGAYNEFSYLTTSRLFIQNCGTASATVPPPSGGMRWKGQVLRMVDSALVLNQNVGLYIQGGAGLSNTVQLETTDFENNLKKHLYCDGVDGFSTKRCQLYSNDSYVAQNGMQFVGTTYTIRGVDIDGTIVRATAGNSAYTAFSITGANADSSARVRGTIWQNFDFAGQTRFSGFQFDRVAMDCALVVVSDTSIVLRPEATNPSRGNKMPLRLRGGAGGTPSTSGEWIASQIASAGIGMSNSGLASSTHYYIYYFDNAGVPAIDPSMAAFVTDTATGYSVKTGDATRLYVGSVMTDGSGKFLTSATGFLNPTLISSTQTGIPAYIWRADGGQLRISATAPASDTSGTIVGTQS